MTQEHTPLLVEEEGDGWFSVDRDDEDGRVASSWTELLTDDGGQIGIVVVDVGFRNNWNDQKLDAAKNRVRASWNALSGIPIEAIEAGVIDQAVEAMRDFCAKVDAGEARSTRSYAKFAAVLEQMPAKLGPST